MWFCIMSSRLIFNQVSSFLVICHVHPLKLTKMLCHYNAHASAGVGLFFIICVQTFFFFLQNCIIYKRKWLSYICCREISLVIWHEWCLGVGAYRSEVMHRKPLLGAPKQVHSCINGEEKMTCDDSLCIVNQGKEKGESKWSCSRSREGGWTDQSSHRQT